MHALKAAFFYSSLFFSLFLCLSVGWFLGSIACITGVLAAALESDRLRWRQIPKTALFDLFTKGGYRTSWTQVQGVNRLQLNSTQLNSNQLGYLHCPNNRLKYLLVQNNSFLSA